MGMVDYEMILKIKDGKENIFQHPIKINRFKSTNVWKKWPKL